MQRIVPVIGTNSLLLCDTIYPRCDYKSIGRLQL